MAKGSAPADPQLPIRTFLSDLIAGRYRRMMEHSSATLKGDPEALHDMRVGSRRLRSTLQNGRGLYRRRRYRRLEATIEEFTTALGRVRDLDVLIDYLARDLDSAPAEDRPYLEQMAIHLGGRREERRVHMEEVLADLSRRAAVARFLAFFTVDRTDD